MRVSLNILTDVIQGAILLQSVQSPQGQYWIEYLYLLLATPPYIAAANFVVITNGGELLEQPISTNSVPRTFFPRVAIGCRLLGGVLIGGYMR